MCLGIPMQIVTIESDGMAMVALGAVRYRIGLDLIGTAQAGEYVIVHAGYAIEKLDQAEADIRLALFEEIAQAGLMMDGGVTP
ncbi:MAG: HypC/HybG/HupF family hydrogenase formation chaperone [Magnetococcus sp. YQC-5]